MFLKAFGCKWMSGNKNSIIQTNIVFYCVLCENFFSVRANFPFGRITDKSYLVGLSNSFCIIASIILHNIDYRSQNKWIRTILYIRNTFYTWDSLKFDKNRSIFIIILVLVLKFIKMQFIIRVNIGV